MTTFTPEQIAENRLKFYSNTIDKIEEYGFTLIGIFPTKDEPDTISFVYTVGMAVHGGYEFLIAGLNVTNGYNILYPIWDKLVSGWRPSEMGILTDLANLPCRTQLMTDEHEANMSRWYWDGQEATFKVMQVVWSDKNGILPGDPGFDGDEFIARQKVEGSAL